MTMTLFQHSVFICVLVARIIQAFQFPASVSGDLAMYSSISATSTCSSAVVINGTSFMCNSTCLTRTNITSSNFPLKSLDAYCKAANDTLPSSVVSANGDILFDETSTNCSVVMYGAPSTAYFTLTLWIKVTCATACDILTIGADMKELKLVYGGDGDKGLRIYLNNLSSGIFIERKQWYFIAIRFNGKLSWFVNNREKSTQDELFMPSPTNITLGPNTNLTGTDQIQMADARWHNDALTDREIEWLYSGTFLDAEIQSECRCPAKMPKLVKWTFPVQYMKCTDGMTEVLRLNPKAYLPQYMTDNDTTTRWISAGNADNYISLTLKKQFQLKAITLTGVLVIPESLSICLYIEGVEHVYTISTGQHTSGDVISYNFATDASRLRYKQTTADKIVVKAIYLNPNYFTVTELKLEARCNCYGNDESCVINEDSYTCNCSSHSHTTGENCDTCIDEYYQKLSPSDEFQCGFPCDCNATGSVNMNCAKIGGQCTCRPNVEGRQCSTCKKNTDNYGADGCTECTCNPDGISSCSHNLTCNCKLNVEISTGNCMNCLPNYYGINNANGCSFCNCDAAGTVQLLSDTCDKRTGQCECREHVQGRTCNNCKPKYFGLSSDKKTGCDDCNCNFVGSHNLICNKADGQCPCIEQDNHTADGNRRCVPRDLQLHPQFGPLAGGTLLTVTGSLLGSSATATLSFRIDGISQDIVSWNQTSVVIKTKELASTERRKDVSLVWFSRADVGNNYTDGNFESSTYFDYMINPQIIVPTSDKQTFASGGCTLNVIGSNLNSVPYPMMLVHLDGRTLTTPCHADTAKHLACLTPNVTDYGSNFTLPYGFRMDGVTQYENATDDYDTSLVIVPDPEIETGMTETYRNTFDKTFTIKGKRLDEACHDADFIITLGEKNCALLQRTSDSISCNPGESFPGQSRTVQVKVKIGNIEMIWGELQIKSFWATTVFMSIAAGVGVVILMIIVVACYVRVRRGSRSKSDLTDSQAELTNLDMASKTSKHSHNTYTEFANPIAVVAPQENQPKTSKMIMDDFCKRLERQVKKIVNTSLIEKSTIDIGNVCTHKGKKIRVVNGQYNSRSSTPDSSLTIKTLVGSYAEEGELPEWLNAGLLECTRLRDFIHDNILMMKGIAMDAKNIYIIYPQMANRTLKDYLVNTHEQISEEIKLEMCIQVSEGMNYLNTLAVVHKDLAARNCWVSSDYKVNISDASFTYDLYPEEYLESNGRYQPIRWMAPECLRQGYYDSKSDVWAYGVLVWEVFANGYMPYHDIANRDLQTKVCNDGYRLGKPDDCSNELFHVIEQCHMSRGDDRPNFYIIGNMLDNVVNPEDQGPISYVNNPLEEDYMNTETLRKTQDAVPPRPPKGRKP